MDIDKEKIDVLIHKLKAEIKKEKQNQHSEDNIKNKFSIKDYPLLKKHYDEIRTLTDKLLSNITLENIKNNKINKKDISISAKTLLIQSQIAENDNKIQLSKNLQRAAEMVNIQDDELIKIYDMLRPNRASENELLNIAKTLEIKYKALNTAEFIRKACEVYKKRGLLIK